MYPHSRDAMDAEFLPGAYKYVCTDVVGTMELDPYRLSDSTAPTGKGKRGHLLPGHAGGIGYLTRLGR